MLLLISAVFMLIFALLGWLLRSGRIEPSMSELLAPAKKGEVNKEALGRYMGALMFALSACLALMTLGIALHKGGLQFIAVAAFILFFAVGMVYPNLSDRFMK